MLVLVLQVEEFVKDKCTDQFDAPMLEPARDRLLSTLMGWIKCLFGKVEKERGCKQTAMKEELSLQEMEKDDLLQVHARR